MKIFPSSIIENSVESHFVQHSTKSKIIYQVVLLSIISAFISSFFIKVDITSQNRGQVKSIVENNKLHSCIYGQVLKENIKEYKQVNAGDTLVWFDTKAINDKINLNIYKYEENNHYIQDLKTLTKGYSKEFITSKYKSEFLKFNQEYKEAEINNKYLNSEFKISEDLYKKNALSKSEYEQIKNKYNLSSSNLKQIKFKYKSNWENTINQLEIANSEITSSISQLKNQKRQYSIIAPISGTIMNYIGIAKEGFIAPNQTIAEISSNKSLIVDCYVSPKDIGYIKTNMKLKYQFDAYNYNQWGLGTGTVLEISKDAIQIDKQIAFRVKCKLNEEFLELKNGYKGKIIKGMTTTVRFHITERTLSQLLYDKVDDWLNPKIQ